MHGSMFTKPLNILKITMRSLLTLLVSSVCKCRSHNLSAYVLSLTDVISNEDWFKILNPQLNDCETMWQIFKDKLFEGEKLFVPLVKTFNLLIRDGKDLLVLTLEIILRIKNVRGTRL